MRATETRSDNTAQLIVSFERQLMSDISLFVMPDGAAGERAPDRLKTARVTGKSCV